MRRAGADIWIAPPKTELVQPGGTLPESTLWAARSTPGVAWAAPMLMGGGNLALPTSSSQPVTIIGLELPALRGGPWNVVAGDPRGSTSPTRWCSRTRSASSSAGSTWAASGS